LFDQLVLANDERRWFHQVVQQQWAWGISVHRRLLRSFASRSA
jgi:hypothetical protein